jgi:hypothetical protein
MYAQTTILMGNTPDLILQRALFDEVATVR